MCLSSSARADLVAVREIREVVVVCPEGNGQPTRELWLFVLVNILNLGQQLQDNVVHFLHRGRTWDWQDRTTLWRKGCWSAFPGLLELQEKDLGKDWFQSNTDSTFDIRFGFGPGRVYKGVCFPESNEGDRVRKGMCASWNGWVDSDDVKSPRIFTEFLLDVNGCKTGLNAFLISFQTDFGVIDSPMLQRFSVEGPGLGIRNVLSDVERIQAPEYKALVSKYMEDFFSSWQKVAAYSVTLFGHPLFPCLCSNWQKMEPPTPIGIEHPGLPSAMSPCIAYSHKELYGDTFRFDVVVHKPPDFFEPRHSQDFSNLLGQMDIED